MNQAYEQAKTTMTELGGKPPKFGSTYLRGGTFILVRGGWIAVVLLVLGLVLVSIPTYAAYLHLPGVASALAHSRPGGCKNYGRGDSPSMPT